MSKNGFIKLHRKTLDNPIVMKDGDHLSIWVWLLMKATWCESDCLFDGKRIKLMPGQLPPISRRTIASELQISESKVQRVLKSFENEHQIEQLMGAKCRLISIVSWEAYQECEPQTEPQVNTKRTTSEPQVNTIKEYKKNKKEKNIYKDVPSEIREPFMEWIAMRNKLKRPIVSETGVTRALNKLNALSKNPVKQKELIEYAIYKNWLSFYPIPEEDKIPKPKVEEETKPIKAEPMPEDVKNKLAAMGMANVIGRSET